ncbi:MAG: PEP-CTERM sorting domain-containing protein [Verrucomicrobiales bacterium]
MILSFASLAQTASGLNIMLDYSYDTFDFGGRSGGAAKAAIDQAAADISSLITTSLSAFTQSSFTAGGSTVNVTTTFRNPTTNAAVIHDPVANPIAADTVVIYVGSQALTGTTLAQGGPSSFSLSGSGVDFAAAATLANIHMGRGDGPQIGQLSKVGGSSVDIKLGSSVGNLWFDINTNDDASLDSDTELEAFWHFDHTTAPTPGKYDLYSVAKHEILHAIGVGTSDSWDNLNGAEWTGANAIAANGGSGAGLVTGGHFSRGVTSVRLSDGAAQEPLMGPSITAGSRKDVTELDAAVLQDIEWSTAAVPEPGTPLLLLLATGGFLIVRRRSH